MTEKPVHQQRTAAISPTDRVVVGRFGRPRGLDGEIYITPETDFPERFYDMKSLTFQRGQRWWLAPLEEVTITAIEQISGRPVVKLSGYESPEAVAALTHGVITVSSEEIVAPPAGHVYVFELVGCKIVDQAGTLLGEIEEVERYPANDAYRVRTPLGAAVLFPAVASLVKNIDMEKREITVDPAGLFDTIRPLHMD